MTPDDMMQLVRFERFVGMMRSSLVLRMMSKRFKKAIWKVLSLSPF